MVGIALGLDFSSIVEWVDRGIGVAFSSLDYSGIVEPSVVYFI